MQEIPLVIYRQNSHFGLALLPRHQGPTNAQSHFWQRVQNSIHHRVGAKRLLIWLLSFAARSGLCHFKFELEQRNPAPNVFCGRPSKIRTYLQKWGLRDVGEKRFNFACLFLWYQSCCSDLQNFVFSKLLHSPSYQPYFLFFGSGQCQVISNTFLVHNELSSVAGWRSFLTMTAWGWERGGWEKYVSMSMTVFVTQSWHLLATKQHVSLTVFVTQSQHVFATKHHVSMTSLTWSFCHQSCYFDFPPFPPLAVLTADQSKLTATYQEIDFFEAVVGSF